MTTATGTGLDALRARFGAALGRHLESDPGRPRGDAARLAARQRERLRALLARAAAGSAFHARRLAGVDPARFELADLACLPVMSKQQMMAGFDELATDRRLTRTRVERHLAASAAEPSLLLGRYVCLASGGSSGLQPARGRPDRPAGTRPAGSRHRAASRDRQGPPVHPLLTPATAWRGRDQTRHKDQRSSHAGLRDRSILRNRIGSPLARRYQPA
jgi:hypothetical protein